MRARLISVLNANDPPSKQPDALAPSDVPYRVKSSLFVKLPSTSFCRASTKLPSASTTGKTPSCVARVDSEPDEASKILAEEKGPCPDAAEYGFNERFSNKTAIAPTASISIICGGTSPGVEPIAANSYTHKTLSGSYNVRNKYLEKILEKYKKNNEEIWSSITTNQGSVSHLDFLTDLEKDVFKTAFELDQRWIVDLGADRTPYISQAQSINIFLPADVHKKELHQIHFQAWKKGLKSLYYCRSKSIQRAENINSGSSTDVTKNVYSQNKSDDKTDYDECLSCQ